VNGEPLAPYKGLRPFEDTRDDVRFFFGRDRDRELIVANLIASRLTVLYGETGVGKSSVLRAGVAHHLRAEARRDAEKRGAPPHAVCVFDRWQDDPVEGIGKAAAATVRAALGRDDVSPQGGETLADRLGGWTELLGGDLYLVLDQTEEFFLYHESEGARNPFVEELAEVVRRPGLRVSVLISLREDSVAKLDRFKGPIPNVLGNYLRLDYLDRAAGRGAILGPIAQFNAHAGNGQVEIEDELVDAVLGEVATGRLELGPAGRGSVEGKGGNGRIETPFLQLVMQRLWDEERRSGSSVLRLRTLRSLGGSEQIVHDHLNQAMEGLASADRDVAASVFDYLVTPSGTKIAHGAADLARYAGVDERRVQPVLSALTKARILRPVAGEGGTSRYEIYHDVLGGAVLGWRTSHEAERELAGERERARRRHRRLLGVIAVGSVLFALMAAMTAYALTQRNEAQEKTALAEVARADALKQAEIARAQKQVAESEESKADAARKEALASATAATRAREEAQLQRGQAENAEGRAEAQAQIAEDEAARAEEAAARAQEAEEDAQREAENAREKAAAARAARADADRAARKARARADAEEALTLLPSRPLESLKLALRSAEQEPNPLAARVLRTVLVSSRVRHVLPGGGGPVTHASFSPDGRRVLTVAQRARVWDARTGALVRGLGGAVSAAAFSPDGRSAVTSGLDGRARIWPIDGGAPRVMSGHRGAVQHATYARDGRLVATASADRTAMLWSATTGERLATFEHDGRVEHVEISPDGTLVLTVSTVASTGRRIARLFDARSGASIRTFDQIGITTAIFSPDGSFVVTTSTDDTARVWYQGEPQARAVLRHLDGNVVSAAFSADGTRLVTATEGSSAVVWHVGTWQRELGVVGPLNPATTASFSSNRRHIVVSSRDRNAHIFHADNGLRVAVLSGHAESVSVAAFSPDGRALVTASADGSARIWDPGTEDVLEVVGSTSESAVRRVSLAPDGRLAVSAVADGTARIVDVFRRRQLEVLRHESAVNDASFSPDGRLVLTASDDGSARLWRPGGELVRVLPHGGRVLRAIFSPDGLLVSTAGADGVVRVWRTRDGALRRVLRGHSGAVLDVAFNASGTLLASAGDNSDKTARVWSVSGRELHVLRHRGPVVRVAFSPDGRLLATASGDEMGRLWSVANGKLRRTLRGHTDFVTDVDFRPDGKVLVTASDDGDARTWSVATGKPLGVLRGHFSGVQTARFSRDGRWIVTAGPRTAGLWDARTGQFFAPTGLADPFLRGPLRGPVTTAVFTPDGRRIVTASGDGTVRVFQCTACGSIDELIRLARARLASLERTLTEAERLRYLRA
jgi:WD40 repeat protein